SLAFSFAGCATKPKVEINPDTWGQSTIGIQYGLGNNQYELKLEGKGQEGWFSSFTNGALVMSFEVDKNTFLKFSAKVDEFLDDFEKHLKSIERGCKSPFIVTKRGSGKIESVSGCRADTKNGAFGKLVREAEILFISDPEVETSEKDQE
ncbi:MAG: hypothetical protein KDD34_10090, partial [Bdellovibrionales bacterium]|nr:hypothetical protein [Bdellovibrionales bacterium]